MMRRFIPEDLPRYVSAIESSPSFRQAIRKLGGKHNDYETIKRVAKETGARLLPRTRGCRSSSHMFHTT